MWHDTQHTPPGYPHENKTVGTITLAHINQSSGQRQPLHTLHANVPFTYLHADDPP
jgi:hypothetical protein